ncbi:MAG: tRNA (adenosine(37)-N6)-threonylcarbamoyltransferase complex ATPase subunit type 1 TsaE [Clostridia bacterium]|nr:tRNA (adenosine(37)-N6)-threonylcarbamoyltransferase complex ATPase subunit type 1 TsaE [Clostridia bacterium]
MKKTFSAETENDLRKIAERLAALSKGGEFIAFFGGLGAGKTTFVRYFAAAFGMDAAASPTFTIVRHYDNDRASILHFDCYRLADAEELEAIGFSDYLDSGSTILMEWSENVLDVLPDERLEIHIEGSGAEPRRIEMDSFGERYDAVIGGLEI